MLELESWTPDEEEPDESPEADDTLQSPAEEDDVDSVSKAAVDWVVGAAMEVEKERQNSANRVNLSHIAKSLISLIGLPFGWVDKWREICCS